jgi:hypothetical protein
MARSDSAIWADHDVAVEKQGRVERSLGRQAVLKAERLEDQRE